ncbi:MAG: YitT family protein, partial [Acutalibacteraceae bacterium]
MDKYLRPLSVIIEMFIGTALTSAAFGLIIVPQSFAAGGTTGFSQIIVGIIPVPLSVMVLIVNMVLLVLGLVFIGRKFIAKTVSISILFPVMLEFFSHYSLNSIAQDPMLCTVVAGVMLGVGSGLILRSGASSGGFDILAVILNKRFKIPVATVMNICDAAVILMQSLNQPLSQTIYGVIVITISATIVGRIVTMGTGESQITIFSEHHAEIRNALLNELDVGMTSFIAET